MRGQGPSSNARRAARTALSMSGTAASAAWAISSPVAGLCVSNVLPVSASTYLRSISSFSVLPMAPLGDSAATRFVQGFQERFDLPDTRVAVRCCAHAAVNGADDHVLSAQPCGHRLGGSVAEHDDPGPLGVLLRRDDLAPPRDASPSIRARATPSTCAWMAATPVPRMISKAASSAWMPA